MYKYVFLSFRWPLFFRTYTLPAPRVRTDHLLLWVKCWRYVFFRLRSMLMINLSRLNTPPSHTRKLYKQMKIWPGWPFAVTLLQWIRIVKLSKCPLRRSYHVYLAPPLSKSALFSNWMKTSTVLPLNFLYCAAWYRLLGTLCPSNTGSPFFPSTT